MHLSHVCIHLYNAHACMHKHTICIYIHIYIHVQVYQYMRMDVDTSICIYAHIHMHICGCMCASIHIDACTHMCIYVHFYPHEHTPYIYNADHLACTINITHTVPAWSVLWVRPCLTTWVVVHHGSCWLRKGGQSPSVWRQWTQVLLISPL